VAGYDVETGVAKGAAAEGAEGVRFAEVVVNGPKTWSLAAALDPEISRAYDAAQTRAAEQIIAWVAGHATTRVGPRGLQVQVPVERFEAAVIRHQTSRTGHPHRHLHLQVNARVVAEGQWRGLHTVGVRDLVAAVNGIGHAAVMCDPEFRTVLARHGFTLDESGEIDEADAASRGDPPRQQCRRAVFETRRLALRHTVGISRSELPCTTSPNSMAVRDNRRSA
jgi:hypothetical protein